jgi:hypothetical protein
VVGRAARRERSRRRLIGSPGDRGIGWGTRSPGGGWWRRGGKAVGACRRDTSGEEGIGNTMPSTGRHPEGRRARREGADGIALRGTRRGVERWRGREGGFARRGLTPRVEAARGHKAGRGDQGGGTGRGPRPQAAVGGRASTCRRAIRGARLDVVQGVEGPKRVATNDALEWRSRGRSSRWRERAMAEGAYCRRHTRSWRAWYWGGKRIGKAVGRFAHTARRSDRR